MSIYPPNYSGYVYLWYDTKAKFYYLGGHYGKVDDKYICSNKPMRRAYDLRPETFKFRVLEYVYGDTKVLRKAEQYWLSMIKDSELLLSENIYAGTTRYYNVKKISCGGNGKGTNKGKSTIGGWNRGMAGIQSHSTETRMKMSEAKKLWWSKQPKIQKPKVIKGKRGGWNKGFTKENYPQLRGGRKRVEPVI